MSWFGKWKSFIFIFTANSPVEMNMKAAYFFAGSLNIFKGSFEKKLHLRILSNKQVLDLGRKRKAQSGCKYENP